MANTQDEPECSDGNVDILPQPEDRLTFKKLIVPANAEPSPLSGLIVNICTSILGETRVAHRVKSRFYRLIADPGHRLFSPPGVLTCVFSIVAVQGGYAHWSLSILGVIVTVCLLLITIIWRQPQSRTQLAFKVSRVLLPNTSVRVCQSEIQHSVCAARDVMLATENTIFTWYKQI